MKDLAPILLFVYNRPQHVKRAISSLLQNREAAASDLYVFSDAARSAEDAAAVEMVRKEIADIQGFRSVSVVERNENFGLARSIIEGVTSIVNRYGRVIVLEDGHVACDGAPQDVLVQAELLERLNLDLPFAAELSLELQRRGVPVGMHIETTTLKEELCRLLSKA